MQSVTVEFHRFGDATGVLRLSDLYIRTVGTQAPAAEVGFELAQETLVKGMRALDYGNFRSAPGDQQGVRNTAEFFLEDIAPFLRRFLAEEGSLSGEEGELCQVDFVTSALELAQLPFEILEESMSNVVLTRRIRQPWPPPSIVRDDVPRVLFAWAAPKRGSAVMKVPHEEHRALLDEVLGGGLGGTVVEVPNATLQEIEAALGAQDRFTHVHLLAHGVESADWDVAPGGRINLEQAPPPSTLLALAGPDGAIERCHPDALAQVFKRAALPETMTIATCSSAEIDPIRSGATLAHTLHAAGVPVVLASQLALTQVGSQELIRTFLAGVVNGRDPREALRNCRDALRESTRKTYYDRVALVGYVQVDEALDERLKERRFKVALARLKATSRAAEKSLADAATVSRAAKGLTPEQREEAEGIRRRFQSVRERLAELAPDRTLTPKQREELYGLQGSSLKREAEAAWGLAGALTGTDKREWLEHSHSALRAAARAYRAASAVSLDHHWSWVQWLALEAVQHGSLQDREEDWFVAKSAARAATALEPHAQASDGEREQVAESAVWGWGSLCELHLLAPLAGRGDEMALARECLAALVDRVRELPDPFPIESTRNQLERYLTWWGADRHWPLPGEVVDQARLLLEHLNTLSPRRTTP